MKFVREKSGGETNAAIGAKLGITGAAVGRWSTSSPKPEQVRNFADTYGVRRVDAFVAAGLLDPGDVEHLPDTTPSVADFTNRELLDEVERRMSGGYAAYPPPLHLAADNGKDDGVEQGKQLHTLGEESQDHGHNDPA